MAPGPTTRPPGRMGIGEVLRRLREEFPDVSISKIRFLETEGLVDPERTPAGYRKFSPADLDQLRYVLGAQRDHYLPLKVIREHLDAMARGLEPPESAGAAPRAPRSAAGIVESDSPRPAAPELRMSRAELRANSGLTDEQLHELHEFGLVRPRPGGDEYDGAALAIASTVAAIASYGLEPRHLRIFKTAADREVGLIDQIVAPVARQRDETAGTRALDIRRELAALSTKLHAALVLQALDSHR